MRRANRVRWGRVAWFWAVWALVVVGSSVLLAKSAHADGMTESELDGHMQNYYNQVVDAIYLAEGGNKAKKPFGILSVPCSDYSDCRKVAYNTVRNNYHRWIKAGRQGDYIQFLANRYCPVGADNDPRGLNRHWYGNVTRLIERG